MCVITHVSFRASVIIPAFVNRSGGLVKIQRSKTVKMTVVQEAFMDVGLFFLINVLLV